ncbi:hypothetical protein pdam_00019347 [Pocillopora damicornis]|uniref:Uncharacterized protein n=1 Tax=Pocillopora damicornis TaxID=46731 RepID=A0A3M6V0D6_POCDA|nr:hypothetical protein pdam_00019347 [Pocillopora damicornis]
MKETHIEQYFLEKKDSIHSEYNYQNRFQRTIFHINLPSLFAYVAVLSVSPQPSGKRGTSVLETLNTSSSNSPPQPELRCESSHACQWLAPLVETKTKKINSFKTIIGFFFTPPLFLATKVTISFVYYSPKNYQMHSKV